VSFASPRRLAAAVIVLVAAGLLGPGSTAAEASSPNPITPGNFTGRAFDQCNAPSQHAMDAWRHSPYRGVGIYISGALRACSQQKHLTRKWVRTQLAHGWKLLPIHVGRQASCSRGARYRGHKISARPAHGYAVARAQGRAEANSATRAARALGLAPRSTIYYDLEGFRVSGPTCRDSTLQFLSAWTQRLRANGYTSGVYSGAASGIRLLDRARTSRTGIALPHHIWIADWDGRANTASAHVRPGGWQHRRVKQYRGDHHETHGGVRIAVDSNYVDLGSPAPLPKRRPKVRPEPHKLILPKLHRLDPLRTRVEPAPRPVPPSATATRCSPAQLNLADYPSTGSGKRTWLHPVLQCLLKQQGLYAARVTGGWNAATASGMHTWQARAGHDVKTKMNRSDWVALLVAGTGRTRLHAGSHGQEVVRLQRALHAAGLTDLHITGTYDHSTALAVRSYQRRVSIPETGLVGRTTWRYLQAGHV